MKTLQRFPVNYFIKQDDCNVQYEMFPATCDWHPQRMRILL